MSRIYSSVAATKADWLGTVLKLKIFFADSALSDMKSFKFSFIPVTERNNEVVTDLKLMALILH